MLLLQPHKQPVSLRERSTRCCYCTTRIGSNAAQQATGYRAAQGFGSTTCSCRQCCQGWHLAGSCSCRSSRRVALAATTSAAAAATDTGPARQAAGLSVGQVVTVACERIGTGGVGVCHCGPSKLVLLVSGALPGEELTAVITAVKKNYAEATKLSTLSPHRDAATPACQHYGTCGGCSLQALQYSAQLAHKVEHVAQLLTRVGQLDAAAVRQAQQPPVAADAVYGYRNKLQLAFSSKVWQSQPLQQLPLQQQHSQEGHVQRAAGQQQDHDPQHQTAGVQQLQLEQQQQQLQQQQEVPQKLQGSVQQGFGLGYLLPGSHSVVVPITECLLASKEMNQVMTHTRHLCQKYGLQPYNSPDGNGVLRHLIIRSAAGPAAAAAASAPGPAAAGGGGSGAAAAAAAPGLDSSNAAAAAGTCQLMAVLVTTAAINRQPQMLKALQHVAQELMSCCTGLVSVVHSIEAPSAAALTAAAAAIGGNTRGSSRSKGSSLNGRGSRSGRSSSDSGADDGSGSGSGRGARALRVQSSHVLAGSESLTEVLCGLQFQLSPHSFFQVNSAQAEKLYKLVVQAAADGAAAAAEKGSRLSVPDAAVGSGCTILDLYCGTGTITLCLATALPHQRVVGFDVSSSSISDAQANAARNGITNASFVCGDLNQLLPAGSQQLQPQQGGKKGSGDRNRQAGSRTQRQQQQQPQQQDKGGLQGLRPGVVVVDPARAGLGPGVVQYLLQCGAHRLVYVSCNAATQARDLQQLCRGGGGSGGGGGFVLTSWTCVDLFPQTDVGQVETVVVLDRV